MKLSKKILVLLFLIGTLFLTACGIEVSTDMNLEEGFQGKRVISCFVSTQDMNTYFKGDITKIDSMLENSCPGCFTYSKEETAEGTTFIFELPFHNLEEYEAAVSSVLNFSPEITYTHTDSIFSKQLELKENFSSVDLLRWFEILLTEEYSIKENQLESLWDVKDTSVIWQDETLDSESENITVSYSKQVDFQGIEIYTTETDQRSFERKICFKIPETTLDTEVLHLQKTFEELTPKDASGQWINTKSGKNYEIVFESSSFAALSEMTSEILMTDTQNATETSTFTDYHFLQYDLVRMEELDFSHFLCTKDGEVPIKYYYKPNRMTETNVVKIQKEINNSFTNQTTEDGFYELYNGSCSTLIVGYYGTMTVPVNSYQVTTSLKRNNKFERTFLFELENILTKEESKQLQSFFKKNNTSNLNISFEEKDGQCLLTVKQNGTKDNLNYSSRLLFGSENNAVSCKETGSILMPTRDIAITEEIDLSAFLGEYNKNINGEYTFVQETNHTLNKYDFSSENCETTILKSSETSFHTLIRGTNFTSQYEETIFYIPGIILYILLTMAILLGLWVLIKHNPLKKEQN